MNNHAQIIPLQNGNHGPRGQRNSLGDYRNYDSRNTFRDTSSNGPVPVPPRPPGMNGHGFTGSTQASGGFASNAWDVSRSPPAKQNTSHVPCKFFLQGTCQAGKACPFSHDKTLVDMTPCKYFAKGNCKFGAKCALPHVLPDGRLANQPMFGMAAAPFTMSRAGPINSNIETRQPGQMGELQGSMLSALGQPLPYTAPDDYFNAHLMQKSYGTAIRPDGQFQSPPGSNYGSPPNESRYALSPAQKGLSALDAPLPASFDSQGISHFARHGPMASSVPSRFGLDNPLASTSPPQTITTTARGFGNLNNLATVDINRTEMLTGLGSSPPSTNQSDTLPRRILHSSLRARSHVMSSSLPRPILGSHLSDDEDEAGFEDDLDQVPSSLHDDVLTPQEKARRLSRTEEELGLGFGAKRSLGFGSPPSSKTGSPSSRYGGFFASRTKTTEPLQSNGVSPFGHVGSPLRNSSINLDASPIFGPISRPRSGDVSPFVSSPPRGSSLSGIGGIGMLSQQLQLTRLGSGAGVASDPPMDSNANNSSNSNIQSPIRPPSFSALSASRLDRTVSSSSIGRERIVEEQGLFSMDDDEEQKERDRQRLDAGQLSVGLGSGGGAAGSTSTSAVKRWSGGAWNPTSPLGSEVSSPKIEPMASAGEGAA